MSPGNVELGRLRALVQEYDLGRPGRPAVLGADAQGYWFVADARTGDRLMCGFSVPQEALRWAMHAGWVRVLDDATALAEMSRLKI